MFGNTYLIGSLTMVDEIQDKSVGVLVSHERLFVNISDVGERSPNLLMTEIIHD